MPPMSLWRPDKMRELTYTQFWELVRERQIQSVSLVCMTARQDMHSRQAVPLWTCHVCDWGLLRPRERLVHMLVSACCSLLLSWQTPPCCLLLQFCTAMALLGQHRS